MLRTPLILRLPSIIDVIDNPLYRYTWYLSAPAIPLCMHVLCYTYARGSLVRSDSTSHYFPPINTLWYLSDIDTGMGIPIPAHLDLRYSKARTS